MGYKMIFEEQQRTQDWAKQQKKRGNLYNARYTFYNFVFKMLSVCCFEIIFWSKIHKKKRHSHFLVVYISYFEITDKLYAYF